MKKRPASSGIVECRAMYGDAFHLISRDNKEKYGEAFCGYTGWVPAASDLDIIPEEIIAIYEQGRRESWHYCAACVLQLSRLTSLSMADAAEVSEKLQDKARENAERLRTLTKQLPHLAA